MSSRARSTGRERSENGPGEHSHHQISCSMSLTRGVVRADLSLVCIAGLCQTKENRTDASGLARQVLRFR